MTGLTRGRLPARVYWVRRLLVLGLAALLVVGIAHLLGGSSNGSSGPDRATTVADTSASPGAPGTGQPTSPLSTGPTSVGSHRGPKHASPEPPLAEPSGPCAPDDITITPSVPHPVAGHDVALVLDLSTISSPACYWTLSRRSLALKITSWPHFSWTSVQCGRVIPTQDLVLRSAAPTRVKLTWDARRSEPGCPRQAAWAVPGTYHLHVAALAGKPSDLRFDLTAPSPVEVTRTADPTPHRTHHPSGG